MRNMLTAGLTAITLLAGSAMALADPLEGTWKTSDCGEPKVKISACGGSFCVDVVSGEYSGKRSGKLKPDGGGVYSGKLRQFSTGITFNGIATLKRNKLDLVAKKFGVVVKRDKWCRS